MGKTITTDYTQQFILPPSIEEWVPENHPARFIREFVSELDLAELGFQLPAAQEGRPPYDAELLLRIWLYGYMHGIRSSRKLEAACREHLSLLWLATMVQPDHNSLWRFWKKNQQAIRAVYKQTVQVAVRSGCVGLVLQAVDGTKIAAGCSSRTGWSKEHMKKLLAALDHALHETELEIAREGSTDEDVGYRLPAGLTERKKLREEIVAGLAQLEADNRKHYHPEEPEARRMQLGQENRFGYNAQAVTDGACGIIVGADVTREENDRGQLVPMIEQVQETIGVAATNTETLADTGYGAGADVQAASEKKLNVLVRPAEGAPARDHPYATQHFHYDPKEQTVTCPEHRTLEREGSVERERGVVERFRCRHHDCPVRAQCTRDPKGRQIEVHVHTPAVQAMRERLRDPQTHERYAQRGRIAERSFAQIKQHDGFRRFTMRGWEAARAQWALVCAAVNLRILMRNWQRSVLRPLGSSPVAVSAAA